AATRPAAGRGRAADALRGCASSRGAPRAPSRVPFVQPDDAGAAVVAVDRLQRLDATVVEHDRRRPLGGPPQRHGATVGEGDALGHDAGAAHARHVLVAVELEPAHHRSTLGRATPAERMAAMTATTRPAVVEV